MSKFGVQQLFVGKVIPPSGYGSRKSAWLSNPLTTGFFGLFLSVSLCSTLLGLTWYQPVLADVISCQPAICPDSYQLKPLCDKYGVDHLSGAGHGGEFCSNSTTGKTYLEDCWESCLCPRISQGQFGESCISDDPATVNIYLEMEKECNELGGHGGRTFIEAGGPTCQLFVMSQQVPKKLGLIDPACSAQTTCKGDFLKETGESVAIDESKLLSASVTRSGVVTDGVTQLLLRVKNNKSVTFTLGGNDSCQFGALMQRDGSSTSCNSLTAEPVKIGEDSYVFAIYRAPLNFPPDSSIPAKVSLEAKSASGEVLDTTNLQLEPPPVILVHGVWDVPGSWNKVFAPALIKNGYKVRPVGHDSGEYPSSGTFDPQLTDSVAIPQLITQTQNAITDFRTRGIALSQVDVVAHSMGGLITRATVKTQNYLSYHYNRVDNYKKGDFHKIITIGTPHQGTRIADVLVHGKCRERKLNCKPKWNLGIIPPIQLAMECQPESLETTFSNLFKTPLIGKIIGHHELGPAIYGFQTGSTAIKNIGDTPVPSHAIVGIAPTGGILPPNVSPIEVALNKLFHFYAFKTVDGLSTVDDILGGNENHDTIVPVQSQQGGLSGDAVSTFHNVDHLGEIGGLGGNNIVPVPVSLVPPLVVLVELNAEAPKIAEKVVSLLRESPKSPAFGHFTALPQQAGNSDVQFGTDSCPTIKRAVRDNHVSNAVITFEPTPGTIVTPGQKVQIRLDITGGDAQEGLMLSIGNQLIGLEGPPPYVVDYTVPDSPEAQINIYAQTVNGDLNAEAYAVESYLTVKLPDTGTTGTTETVPVGSCGTTNETSYTVPLDRSGFYIIEATLPADKRSGLWSLLIDSMSKSPLRSKNIGIRYQGGWHGGVILKENGLSPSWVAFSVGKTEFVTIKASDFLNNLPSFKLEVVKQNDSGWKSVFGPVDALPEQNYTTPPLKPGFYAVVVTGRPESPRGQLGIFVKGNTLYGAVTGGWIDHTGVGYSAFFAGYPQTADLKLLFCGSYGLDGAGEPAVRVLYQKEDGSQEVYWDAK